MLLVHPLDFLEESEKAFRGGPVVTEAFQVGDEFQLLGDVRYAFNNLPLGFAPTLVAAEQSARRPLRAPRSTLVPRSETILASTSSTSRQR
jgi:hypothetical protein